MSSSLRRVYPEPADTVTISEAYASTTGDRQPWVMATMITSLDGATAVDGRSAPLGNANDSAVLAASRRLADVVVVGASTVRVEGYGPPRKPGLRVGVVSNRGDVDLDAELFTSGTGFLIVPEDCPELPVPTVRAGRTHVDLPAAIGRLGEMVSDAAVVQCEGGPQVAGALIEAGAVDELNLTLSPRLVGGPGHRLAHTTATIDQRFELVQLLVDDDSYMFTRWRRPPQPG